MDDRHPEYEYDGVRLDSFRSKEEALAEVKAQPPQGPIVIDPSNLRTGMMVFMTMTDGGRAILVDCMYQIRRKKSGAFTLIPVKQKGGQRARSSR